MGHLLILTVLCFPLQAFWMALGHFDSSYLFLFFIILDSVIKCRGTFESKINLWLFLYVTCIKLCEWSKNGKILLFDPGSFYLLEPFASKESISIVILIFFHVDLNFLHLKVALLEGATKSYLTHYLCVVIIFYHNDLDKSAFMKLQLRSFYVLCIFFLFLVFNSTQIFFKSLFSRISNICIIIVYISTILPYMILQPTNRFIIQFWHILKDMLTKRFWVFSKYNSQRKCGTFTERKIKNKIS